MAKIITVSTNDYQAINLRNVFRNSEHTMDVVFSVESLYFNIRKEKYDIIILDLYMYNSNTFLNEDSLRIIKNIKETGNFDGKFLLCVESNYDYTPKLREYADHVIKDGYDTNNIIFAIGEMCKQPKQLMKKLDV